MGKLMPPRSTVRKAPSHGPVDPDAEDQRRLLAACVGLSDEKAVMIQGLVLRHLFSRPNPWTYGLLEIGLQCGSRRQGG